MLVWYSQEARCYSLLVLLTSISLLFFLRARRTESGATWPGGRSPPPWRSPPTTSPSSGSGRRAPGCCGATAAGARRALGWVAAVAVLLAPLALWQMGQVDHTDWIERFAMPYRIGQTAVAFMVGETGDLIAEPVRPAAGAGPGPAGRGSLSLAAVCAARRCSAAMAPCSPAWRRRPWLVPLLLAAAGKDFVIDRNLIPALVPLLLIAALGITASRAGRLGVAIGAALVAYSLGFAVWTNFDSSLQRPDWRAVAESLGEPTQPRAMVTWLLGAGVLRHYLSTGSFQVVPEGERWFIGEVDLISNGPAPAGRPAGLAPSFRRDGARTVGRFEITRYSAPGLAPVSVRKLEHAPIGFRNDRVLMDGIGPTE